MKFVPSARPRGRTFGCGSDRLASCLRFRKIVPKSDIEGWMKKGSETRAEARRSAHSADRF
ncbi:hypothetical protein BFX40_21620 [Mesorhizobium sp. SEMIA 3007]|nr:hypothetical protein BFX40_21620 [Mesorhizobium sp. SEMIA 3007]